MRTLSRTLSRTRVIAPITAATTATVLAAGLLPWVAPAQAAETVPSAREISYDQWSTTRQLRQGSFAGTRAVRGELQIGDPVGTRRYVDPHGRRARRYDLGRWVSPWREPGYALNQLVPSWDATSPGGSWVQVQVRGRSESGRRSRWYTLANWAAGDAAFSRTSLGRQEDELAYVDVDTLKTKHSMGFTSWQTRLTLLRPTGTAITPTVETVGAMTSLLPDLAAVRTSRPGVASGLRPLRVPRYSQMIHRGHYPEYGNGGEAWCSPTSVSMVLGYYDRLPSEREYSWVDADHRHPWVDHAARSTYDDEYDGAGNWSFGTAYAATHADAAFVTRLRSLREAERLIRAGIPVVASVRFGPGELSGAPIRATDGHLLVIVGFTAGGDVVVNDPAAATARGVRRTYDRGQFENAWVPKSGGLVYLIRDDDHPLPRGRNTPW